MPDQTIDYDALAKQHGAISTVDYDALAKQHGAVSSQPAADPKTVSGFAWNALSSTTKLIGDTAGAIAHPIQTLDAAGSIPAGIIEKTAKALGAPVGEGSGSRAFDGSSSKMLDGILDHLKSRYGTFDAAKEALYKDPAGVLADVAAIGSGVGGALKLGGKVATIANAGRAAQLAGDAGAIASKVSSAIDPISNLGRAAGAVAAPVASATGLGKLPAKLYQSALKPSRSEYGLAAAKEIVDTGLQNQLPVSAAGVEKLHGLVQDLNGKIKDVIDAGANKGVTIDPKAVAQRINEIEPRFAEQVNPERDMRSLDASSEEFMRQHTIPGAPIQTGVTQVPTGVVDAAGNPVMKQVPTMQPGKPRVVPIPADQAQAIKQGTYRQMAANFGELKNGQIEAQKALARGIKEELASAFPEIAALNEKESKLLGLQDALERAVRRIDNHDLMGIATPIVAGAAGAAAGGAPVGIAAGIMKAVLDNSTMKSRLAIALDLASRKQGVLGTTAKVAGKVTTPAMSQYGSRIQAYLDSLTSPQQQNGSLVPVPAQ